MQILRVISRENIQFILMGLLQLISMEIRIGISMAILQIISMEIRIGISMEILQLISMEILYLLSKVFSMRSQYILSSFLYAISMRSSHGLCLGSVSVY